MAWQSPNHAAPYALSITQVLLDELKLDGEVVDVSACPTAVLDGPAHLVLKSGSTYTGDLQAGELHGKGKMVFPDSQEYEGDFVHNAITGDGVSVSHVYLCLRFLSGPGTLDTAEPTNLASLGPNGLFSAACGSLSAPSLSCLSSCHLCLCFCLGFSGREKGSRATLGVT